MNRTEETFDKFINKNGKLSCKELDDFFAGLEPVTIEEMIGEWRVGYLFTKEGTGSKWEIFIKNFPIRLFSKKFLDRNNVKAWVFRFFGIKFSVPGTSAILRRIEFRNKISTSMVYNYLPMLDNFRRLNDNTVMGIMEVKGNLSVYFYLKRIENND